ncbi:unnamed protein product [Pedinophyceae sp. YPF-701]|nr:unnamed protein product [Pedinophyceae sp. YPF-701]
MGKKGGLFAKFKGFLDKDKDKGKGADKDDPRASLKGARPQAAARADGSRRGEAARTGEGSEAARQVIMEPHKMRWVNRWLECQPHPDNQLDPSSARAAAAGVQQADAITPTSQAAPAAAPAVPAAPQAGGAVAAVAQGARQPAADAGGREAAGDEARAVEPIATPAATATGPGAPPLSANLKAVAGAIDHSASLDVRAPSRADDSATDKAAAGTQAALVGAQ